MTLVGKEFTLYLPVKTFVVCSSRLLASQVAYIAPSMVKSQMIAKKPRNFFFLLKLLFAERPYLLGMVHKIACIMLCL